MAFTSFKKAQGASLGAEFVQKRQRALNLRDDRKIDAVKTMIEKVAAKRNFDLSTLETKGDEGWLVAYHRIITRMQRCDLTINLNADSWFGEGDNRYKTYATTYTRNIKDVGGTKVLQHAYRADGSMFEDAMERMRADDAVTLPLEWADAPRLSQRRKLYKAMSALGGAQVMEVDIGDGKKGSAVQNKSFNRHTKQVFAALNYGKRRHGSNTTYGYSYFILDPKLKFDAVYFPMDTFNVEAKKAPTGVQCTYNTMAAVIGDCTLAMAEDIWTSCFEGFHCPDDDSPKTLMEAHIFREVKLNKHVRELALSRRTSRGDMADDVWATVKHNARIWADRNDVRLLMNSA